MDISSDEDVLGNLDRMIEARGESTGLNALKLSAPPQVLAGLRMQLHPSTVPSLAAALTGLGAEVVKAGQCELAVFQTGRDLPFFSSLDRSRTVLASEADVRAFLAALTPAAPSAPAAIDPLALFARQQRSTKNSQWQRLVDPRRPEDIIGNAAALTRLRDWLRSWQQNPHKAVMLCGPCGVGKTSAALLLGRAEGFEVLHFAANASRGKAALEALLGALVDNRVLSSAGELRARRFCLTVMDELEGMQSESGGLAHLAEFIRRSRQPIICIAEDPSAPRLRPVAGLCLQIRMEAPQPAEVSRVLQPFLSQRQDGSEAEQLRRIEELCVQFGGDVRRLLIFLQFWGKEGLGESQGEPPRSALSAFAAARELLAVTASESAAIARTRALHFVDDALMPLFVFEHLPGCTGNLHSLDQALSGLRTGAGVSQLLRTSKNYALGGVDAFFNASMPVRFVRFPPRQLIFPAALSKLSAKQRWTRLGRELRNCLGPYPATRAELVAQIFLGEVAALLADRRFDELSALYSARGLTPLLVREGLHELLEARHCASPLAAVDSRAKAAFTQHFNARSGWSRAAFSKP